ncbi:alkaline phosphatase D family protein [Novosphingobium guangzhouense]|uniref:Alkaline phosphatase n=1 Tax=Novosphingobium guangzhouense TaxID=1850347 RepID=A0A2K2FUY1_9SPHN|nr:alkaline phosphatase D family protein [Novosphingobium guangzhouense]PNU02591.1 alkaline phosphatase [Novosphingobium guangzhouense]
MTTLRTHQVSRRALLAGMAGGVATMALPICALAAAAVNPVFRHGVAAGDPDASSVVLWTRVSTAAATDVQWELSDSPAFAKILKTGTVRTDADRDFTVKALATGLPAGATFFYRFRMGKSVSPIGRARTLPEGRVDTLGIALASCSNYAFGFFNAYDAIAKDAAIDFVLHTGDYIYEYGGKGGWGEGVARTIGREHAPAHEIVTLSDYRTRHAQYKTDAGSLAMHAQHTLLACWDDHESANNPWTGGAENHQPATEGDWTARRAASIRAYYEWMPVREPEWLAVKGRTRAQFWRAYRFGDLALLHTLETRHTARAKQIDYLGHAQDIIDDASAEKFRREVLGAPDRRMIAPELEADLEAALAQSVRDGQPWRVIGCPMVIGRLDVPDLAKLGVLPDPFPKLAAAKSKQELAKLAADPHVSLAWRGRWNLPDYTDTWGGYPWAREQFYALSRRAGAGDLVFLSGDSHSFWTNDLADAQGRPAGIEFGTAGISSPGDFMDSGFGEETARKLDKAYAEHMPEVVWTDNMHQGYVRMQFGRDSGTASFVAVSTVLSRDYTISVIRKDAFRRDGTRLRFA